MRWPWAAPQPAENRGFAIVLLAGAALAFFVLTSALSRAYASHVQGLAQHWSASGEAALSAGLPVQAVDAFENALRYSRSDRRVQMRLAEALILAGRAEEARSHLLALWAGAPGDGRVNVELARLFAAEARPEEAARHFNAAIHGAWDVAADVERRRARQELIALYLGRDEFSKAEAHLVALEPDLPKDAETQTELGDSFMRTGSPRRALFAFRAALSRDPLSGRAAKGAGDAAFRLGDYGGARRYLRTAAQQLPEDASVEGALATVDLIFMMDPYLPRLTTADRARRLSLAWRTAMARLQACALSQHVVLPSALKGPDLPGAPPVWHAYRRIAVFANQLSPDSLRRDPERIDSVMDAVLAAARVSEHCGPREPADEALLILASRHRADEP